jgi:predicted nucleic acid-binding protein
MTASAPTRSLRVLVDTNVVLDHLLNREPWNTDALPFWQARDTGRIVAYLPASVLTDIFYIGRRLVGLERARHAVTQCLDEFGLVPIYRAVLAAAVTLPGPDFEDNVQIACAQFANLDLIVTRNTSDFRHAPVSVTEPAAAVGFLLP